MSIRDDLIAKIKVLNDTVWDRKAQTAQVDEWLANFTSAAVGTEDEQSLHALYLLSQFLYLGSRQMRELLRVLYRDLYKYPIVNDIRKSNGDTTDVTIINTAFNEQLGKTVFLGVGNPAESGCHLLYYFRQENALRKHLFKHSHEIFQRTRQTGPGNTATYQLTLKYPDVTRYVFIDDFCGSGQQGISYSKNVVDDLKALNPSIHVSYFVLCATHAGMQALRQTTSFDEVKCILELDETFRCFSNHTRYFPSTAPEITAAFAESMCREYGNQLLPVHPLGYGDCQLLIGFQHNTPDNTLPIFWSRNQTARRWSPIFRRYPKL